jgi:hypothetical protein
VSEVGFVIQDYGITLISVTTGTILASPSAAVPPFGLAAPRPSRPVLLHAPIGIQAPLQPQITPVIGLLALLLLEAVFPLRRLAVQPVTPGLDLRAVTPKDRA